MTKHPHETIENLKKRVPTKAEIARRTPLGASEPVPTKPVTSTARDLVATKRQRQPAAEPTKSTTVPVVPAARPAPSAAVAVRDGRSYRAKYLDEVAPSGLAGRRIKFDKSGSFVTSDDDVEIAPDAEFVALCDQTLVGWIRFTGVGEPPDRRQGLLYDDWLMPLRESLGDMDRTQWDEGLDGEPADPWLHEMCLVLQNVASGELFTFAARNTTSRRAVGVLLRHFDRMQRTKPGDYPVVRLRKGGFEHRDTRIGFVNTPVFAVVTQHSRDSAAKPDTSIEAVLNDKIPF